MAITINKHIENNYNQLSIQISLSGLSFCILNTASNTITFLKTIDFNSQQTPFKLLDQLKHYFNTEETLKNTFKDVVVIHKNELASLVPKPLFNEDCLVDYLKYNAKILQTDFISFDELKNQESVNVYVPYVNINNYIFDAFGDFTYKHASTILIERLLELEKHAQKEKIYVHVSPNYFEIVIVKNNTLQFYNTFNYITKEDFIYYILFTVEQLQLNPDNLDLLFLGNIDSKDDLYVITSKYVRFVSLGNRLDNYKYTDAAQPNTNHSNFIILNSF